MAQASGRYAVDTVLGQVFHGSTAVGGVALAAYNATAHTFGLWNPLGSGKNAYLISCVIGFVSGTITPSNFTYSYQLNVGAQVATGGSITAGTFAAPLNGLLGGGQTSVCKFAPATVTLAAASLLFRTMGVTMLTTAASTYMQAYENFDGTVIIPPGVFFGVTTNVASGVTADVALVWEEV